MYAKIFNEQTKEVQVAQSNNSHFYKSLGFSEMEVEKGYNGNWYLKGHAPQKPHNEVILEEINALEAELSPRNIRSAFLGDEYALIKIKNIEEQIAELRKQLDK